MDPLDRDSSCDFDSTENALIKQYQNCFLMDEVEFSITEALDFIVGKALEYKLGARGL
jgi:ATP-dependent Clp protease ATP-binding subunit ClpX